MRVELSQYSNIWLLFTPGRVDERRGEGYVWWGWGTVFTVGKSICGEGVGAKRGKGVPSQGASGGFSCLSGAPQTEMGGGGGESGLEASKTRAYDLPRPLTMTAPFLMSPHFHTSCL